VRSTSEPACARHRSALPVSAKLSDFLPAFLRPAKGNQAVELKKELLEKAASLDRGVQSSEEDDEEMEKFIQQLEKINPTKAPLESPLINGKWELQYTTSKSILKSNIPKALRKLGPIYQCIDTRTLQAKNIETWPFFNQVQATLTPLSTSRVSVKFDKFLIGGLVPVKAPDSARGELEITFLDKEMRIARGNKGNVFVLTQVDPDFSIPYPSKSKETKSRETEEEYVDTDFS